MARYQRSHIPWWSFRDMYSMIRGQGVGPVFAFSLAGIGWCSTRLWKLTHSRRWRAYYAPVQRQDEVDGS